MSRNSSRLAVASNATRDRLPKGIVFSLPLIIISCLVVLKGLSSGQNQHESLYFAVIKEDGPVEYLTSLAYFLAFLIALFGARLFFRMRPRRSLLSFLYLFLSLAFFFVAMEEISWGQRIMDISNPAYIEEHNVQDELTLHNLDLLRSEGGHFYEHWLYVVIGSVGAFAWLLPQKIKNKVQCLVPEWYSALYFLPVVVIYLYIELSWYYLGVGNYALAVVTHKEQEPAELLLSLGFLLFVISKVYKQHSGLRWPNSSRAIHRTAGW